MRLSLSIFVFISLTLRSVQAFLNGFERDLNFTCPEKQQAIAHVDSVHTDTHEDRRFDITCRAVVDSRESIANCYWTGYANNFDHTLTSQCVDNYYINGVSSHFESCCGDRVWKFYCCRVQSIHLIECQSSGWTNNFDKPQNFTVPNGMVLKAVTSVYKDYYGDREFSFEYCKTTATAPVNQHRDYGSLVTPASSYANDWDKLLLFECPDQHQTIAYVESTHKDFYDDRKFKLTCVDVAPNIRDKQVNCTWSNRVNAFEEDFVYSCPGNSYLQGMRSQHDNTKEDRVWKYRCCQTSGVGIGDCVFGNWTNLFDNYQLFRLPDDTVMKGVVSQFADEQNDRVYKYEICRPFLLTHTLTEIIG